MKRWIVALLILALAVGVLWSVVSAQSDWDEFEPIIVEGEIQRPHAFYILQRASLEFGMQAKRMSFIHLIEQSVDEEPF